MSAYSSDQQPSAVLRAEHQVILRVVGVLERLVQQAERGSPFDEPHLRECVEFFRWFADACHHAKEEDLLFPVMEHRGIPRDGGPIGVMLEEHRQARALTQAMGEAIDARPQDGPDAERRLFEAARGYIALLRQHIFKEDNILFNMGDQRLTDDDQASLCEKFCEVGCRAFGGKRREELERMADALERACPSA